MRTEFDSGRVEAAEETLRQVAQLPPPDGLEQRVHRRLKEVSDAEPARGFWRLWLPAHRVQFAGAALLVTAVAASTLMVRHPKAVPAAAPAPLQQGTGLGTAGAERHPASLTPIVVPAPPVKKKPVAGHAARHAKPAAAAPVQAEAKTPAP